MRGSLGDELRSLASEGDTGVVNGPALIQLLTEHRQGSVDHSQPLWLAYSYLRWRTDRRPTA